MSDLESIAPFFIVRDLDRSIAFYRDALGFALHFGVPEDGPFFAMLGRGGAQLMLKAIAPAVEPLPNPIRHPWARWDAYVTASDPVALAAEFAARGIATREPPENAGDGLIGFDVTDPDGYVFSSVVRADAG